MLEVRNSPGKGRGVFAAEHIPEGGCLEDSPVIIIPEEEIIHIRRTVFRNYFFQWGENGGAIALGYGSLFNDSYRPNAQFLVETDKQRIRFIAIKPISQGEEITVNYNGPVDDDSRLWFHVLEE